MLKLLTGIPFYKMKSFICHKAIFGPVKSRRLGNSLGINLLPNEYKICNFNCIYCECGWTHKNEIKNLSQKFRTLSEVYTALEQKLKYIKTNNIPVDTITFSGCGEPTIHPKFSEIIDITIYLRNKFLPNTKISVLSNASMLHNNKIINALLKIDQNIQKLDSALNKTFLEINQPLKKISPENIINNLKKFNSQVIIQTLFLRGYNNSKFIDNTSKDNIIAWVNAINEIKPKQVMIYTIDRPTPARQLEKIFLEELKNIAKKIKTLNIDVIIAP